MPPKYRSHVGLLYEPCFGNSNLHRQAHPRLQRCERTLAGKGETVGEKCPVILPTNGDFHAKCRDFLHAANLRHGTDGFTSPPKEGTLWIFSPWKIRQLRPGSNPRTWVTDASVLPPWPPKSLILLTYSMQHSHSCETDWFSAGQEITRMLWNPNADYRIYKFHSNHGSSQMT
jgi:hypothetical protein